MRNGLTIKNPGQAALRNYLRVNNTRAEQFSRESGVSVMYLLQIMSGHRRAGLGTAIKIEKATEGIVAVELWDHKETAA